MKLFEMYNQRIDEAFPIEYQSKGADGWYASFKTPDDVIEIEAEPMAPGHFHLSFSGKEGYGASGDSSAPQEAMATVFQFIAEFLREEDPNKITFSAAKREFDKQTGNHYESARGRLYARKANQIGKKYGYNVHVSDNHPAEYNFTIEKGEGKQAELPPVPSDKKQKKKDKETTGDDNSAFDDVDDIFSRLGL